MRILNSFKEFWQDALETRYQATEWKDKQRVYWNINEIKALDLRNRTSFIFNIVNETVEVVGLGYKARCRTWLAEMSVYSSIEDELDTIEDMVLTTLFDSGGRDPLEGVDIMKLERVEFNLEETHGIIYPTFEFSLIKYYE